MTTLFEAYKTITDNKWVDLTHQISETSPHFPALPSLRKKEIFTHDDGFLVQEFSVVGQYGTHIDAPIHFVKGRRWLEEINLKDLFLPLIVIDKSDAVAKNPDYILSKQDILDFENDFGPIPKKSFVAFRSDWSKRWPDQDNIRNLDDDGVQHTPGWGRDALEYLITQRHITAVGHETLDTDAGVPASQYGLVNEYYLLDQDIYQIEVLANLDKIPATGALISISYPNWEKASGSPVRAIAILPDEE